MKKDIHPEYHPVVFKDPSSDFAILTRSTRTSNETIKWEDGNEYTLVTVEISSGSHPFFTGREQQFAKESRVEKFRKKYGAAQEPPEPEKTSEPVEPEPKPEKKAEAEPKKKKKAKTPRAEESKPEQPETEQTKPADEQAAEPAEQSEKPEPKQSKPKKKKKAEPKKSKKPESKSAKPDETAETKKTPEPEQPA
ncbi:type B 50S ribosomal protein L31 [Candidatus Mycalebacterium sp.]